MSAVLSISPVTRATFFHPSVSLHLSLSVVLKLEEKSGVGRVKEIVQPKISILALFAKRFNHFHKLHEI